jgi:DNA polymerase kappa
MDKWLGMHFLFNTYLGIASNVVQPYQREERKSIGAERYVHDVGHDTKIQSPHRTFSPIADTDRILRKLDEVAKELERDMEESGWTGRTVTLKYKLDTYQGIWKVLLMVCTLIIDSP